MAHFNSWQRSLITKLAHLEGKILGVAVGSSDTEEDTGHGDVELCRHASIRGRPWRKGGQRVTDRIVESTTSYLCNGPFSVFAE